MSKEGTGEKLGESGQKLEKDPGERTPEEVAKEWAVKAAKEKVVGALPLRSQIEAARYLWGVQGKERKEIATILHLGLPVINDACAGIMQGKPPGVPSDEEIEDYLVSLGLAIKKPKPLTKVTTETETPSYKEPVNLPSPALSVENLAKLFMMAIASGFEDLDDFVERELIPWYGVKADWQTKTHSRMSPRELGGVFDIMARKAVKFDSLAQEAITPE